MSVMQVAHRFLLILAGGILWATLATGADKPLIVQASKFPQHFRLAIKWNQKIPYQVEQRERETIVVFDRDADYLELGYADLPPFIEILETKNMEGSFVTTLKIAPSSDLKYAWKNGNFIIDVVDSPLKVTRERARQAQASPSPLKAFLRKVITPPLQVEATESADQKSATLFFKWDRPVKVVMTSWGGNLIIGFSEEAHVDLSSLKKSAHSSIRKIDYLKGIPFDVFILPVGKEIRPRLTQEGQTFALHLQTHAENDETTNPGLQREEEKVFLKGTHLTDPITVEGPTTGFPLVLFPGEISIIQHQEFVPFSLLPTQAGVAVLQKSEALSLKFSPDRIDFVVADPIYISSLGSEESNRVKGNIPFLVRFDTSSFRDPLQEAKDSFSKGNYQEARYHISMAVSKMPRLWRTPEARALMMMCALFLTDYSEAAFHLRSHPLQDDPDASFFQALFDAATGQNGKKAHDRLVAGIATLKTFPPVFRNDVLLLACKTSTQAHENPYPFLENLSIRPEDFSLTHWKDYYAACYDTLGENKKSAYDVFKKLGKSKISLLRYRAQLALVQMRLHQDPSVLHSPDLLDLLKSLKTHVKDPLDREQVALMLSQVHAVKKQHDKSLRVLREASLTSPFPEQNPIIGEQMKRLFTQNILESSDTHPLDLLAFYEEFKSYLPLDNRGVLVQLKLVEAYIALDLLDKAQHLLEGVLTRPGYPEIHMKALFLLADVYMRNGKYKKVVDLLETDTPEKLSTDLRDKRVHLLFKAFLNLKLYDQAYDLMESMEETQDIHLLKLQLAWHRKDWRQAQLILSAVIKDAQEGNEPDPEVIMNYALATFFNEDKQELQRVRKIYLPHMKGTKQEQAFQIITSQDVPSPDKKPLAQHLSEVKQFEGLMARLTLSSDKEKSHSRM